MAKLAQALILDPPEEMHFKAPFSEVTTSFLKLNNPTDQHIFFKLKTTAPKTYCVRPNSGVVEAKKSILVRVMLQPAHFEASEKNKHKFMVQSVFAPDDVDVRSSDAIDEVLKDTPAEKFMNSKLKCVFDNDKLDIQQTDTSAVASDSHGKIDATTLEIASTMNITSAKDSNFDVDSLQKENTDLENKLSELRQQNSQLKEESLRCRVTRGVGSGETQSQSAQTRSTASPVKSDPESSLLSPMNIAVLLFVLFVSIYLGKAVF